MEDDCRRVSLLMRVGWLIHTSDPLTTQQSAKSSTRAAKSCGSGKENSGPRARGRPHQTRAEGAVGPNAGQSRLPVYRA
jgi:hypothetical protein